MARLVRKPRRRRYVADRPDARHTGAAHWIGVDVTPRSFHAERFEANILGVRQDTDGDNAVAEALLAGLSIARLDLRGDPLGVGGQALDTCRREDRQSLLLQAFRELRADLCVFDGNDPVEHFDDRDLRTK